jgi:hypothetical protein
MLIKQLDDMFKIINENGKGAVIFINHMQSVNLLNRLTELKQLQSKGQMKAQKLSLIARIMELSVTLIRYTLNSPWFQIQHKERE